MNNKQVIFKKRPIGNAEADTFELQNNPIPELKEGEILIQNHYISLDPAMRGWMNDSKSYIPPVAINDVMRSGSIGKVIKTNNHPTFKVGDCLTGWGGVQQYIVTNGENYYKVDEKLAPMPMYIGTLGMPGMTAYFGITQVGKIKEGDIVLDNACGSGSFLVAAAKENRKYIGIEKNENVLLHKKEPIDYIEVSTKRIEEVINPPKQKGKTLTLF